MNWEKSLLKVSVELWRTERLVVFDWYDGPRQGVCELATPACEFAFDLIAERHNPKGLDDRLFRLSELPKGVVATIAALYEAGSADAAIDELPTSNRPTNVVVYTRDMETFLDCWEIEAASDEGEDWFARLGV